MEKINTSTARIDRELEEVIKEISKKNDINFRRASQELARMSKIKLRGEKLTREISF